MIDFSNTHILVIGDVMLDEFIYGTSFRQSPEFDAPVIVPTKKIQNSGGAANVLVNLIGLGAKSTLISAIGDDHYGKELSQCLSDFKDSLSFIRSSGIKTIKKTRLYNGDSPICRIDEEEKAVLTAIEVEELKSLIVSSIETNTITSIILQDYNKGLLTPDVIDFILKISKKHEISVFVDPKFENYSSYSGCSVFKPNYQELSQVLGYKPALTKVSLDEAAKKLREYVAYDTLILTLSDKGAYFSSEINSGIINTEKIVDADVCGAGDTFISAMCLALSSKMDLEASIRLANRASHFVCQKTGVQAIKYEDLF